MRVEQVNVGCGRGRWGTREASVKKKKRENLLKTQMTHPDVLFGLSTWQRLMLVR